MNRAIALAGAVENRDKEELERLVKVMLGCTCTPTTI